RMAALPSLANRRPAGRSETVSLVNEERSVPTPANEEEMNEIARSAVSFELEEPKMSETIESIRAEIGNCTRCPLHAQGRTQIVHSTGNFNAELMFVGEAPGADEDVKGEPFVGRAGQLLTKIIEAIGLKREEVFIGNINRCRPPGNRQPLPEEASVCRPYLLREVAVIKPKVIVVLGAHAAHNLLEVKTPISKLRGHFHDYFGTKVMPTFHPAYLLRDPHKKKEVWEDMKMVRDLLRTM
ncbi:MAG TPA: uracil-DNA glycosylase, partial [Pyrinomonadaceae bacterium]|nr:uracil-DNA glycosylase [Pyrinomonadaceae bacterium]